MKILSKRFFGNKVIDIIVYEDLKINYKNKEKIK